MGSSTTLIIFELLIIGFQVLVWVALLLHKLHPELIPVGKLKDPKILKAHTPLLATLLATFAIAIAYTFGIVGDRLIGDVSTILQWAKKTVQSVGREKSGQSQDTQDAAREFWYSEIYRCHAYDSFETANRQIRLLRATFVNSMMTIAVVIGWHRLVRRENWRRLVRRKNWHWPVSREKQLLVSLAALALISVCTWCITAKMQERKMTALYNACHKYDASRHAPPRTTLVAPSHAP
jgi:hypothetical protein